MATVLKPKRQPQPTLEIIKKKLEEPKLAALPRTKKKLLCKKATNHDLAYFFVVNLLVYVIHVSPRDRKVSHESEARKLLDSLRPPRLFDLSTYSEFPPTRLVHGITLQQARETFPRNDRVDEYAIATRGVREATQGTISSFFSLVKRRVHPGPSHGLC